MNWRDFFYFSKGERRAFMLLLTLITTAWLVLMLKDSQSSENGENSLAAKNVLHPVCIYLPENSVKTEGIPVAKNKPVTTSTKPHPSSSDLPLKKETAKRPFYKAPIRTEKFPEGTIVELNTADTTILKKVPGIGSAFSNRIIKYRNLLGGFYTVSQLAEVFGIDEERYKALEKWFCVNPQHIRKKAINHLPVDSLVRHPYINYQQAKVIKQLCRQKGNISGWENLGLLEEFTETDRDRLEPYISFEK